MRAPSTVQIIAAVLAARAGSVTTGNIWFVDSGHTSAADRVGKGKLPNNPFATLAYPCLAANSACGVRANNGDVIVVAAGHTETVSAAGTVTIDVAGLAIFGAGAGSDRPTFNFTATASTFLITAANVRIENFLFTGGIDAVVSAVVISAADAKIVGSEFRDVTGQATNYITTTAAANRLLLDGNVFNCAIAAGGDTCVHLVGGDGITIRNCRFFGNWAAGAILNDTTACTNITVADCFIQNGLDTATADGIVAVGLAATSTGFVGPNLNIRIGVDSTSNAANITGAIVGAAAQIIQPINIVNLGGESSMFTNITASTDA